VLSEITTRVSHEQEKVRRKGRKVCQGVCGNERGGGGQPRNDVSEKRSWEVLSSLKKKAGRSGGGM